MRNVLLVMAGWLLAMTVTAKDDGKVYQFDKPLYGAAYYSEYTPTDRLDEGIRSSASGPASRRISMARAISSTSAPYPRRRSFKG